MLKAEVIGAVMWWWILYHLWSEPEHIIVTQIDKTLRQLSETKFVLILLFYWQGDFPYPDPSKWTNAELGIADD